VFLMGKLRGRWCTVWSAHDLTMYHAIVREPPPCLKGDSPFSPAHT
jgi:hypothetical protein